MVVLNCSGCNRGSFRKNGCNVNVSTRFNVLIIFFRHTTTVLIIRLKVHNRSSEFYPNINEVRREGSYIYETFMETQGADVKVYTIGPNYGHAEVRKSPSLDGVVNRDAGGKEVR